MLRIFLATLLLGAVLPATAQRTVYQCGGVYTDQPCANGREVNIAPTHGANSLSGKRQESPQVQMENLHQAMQDGQRKGAEQYQQIVRCNELKRRRESIDSADDPMPLKQERFAIRQEQFKLSCKEN